ncbi:MAG: cytochrome C oxidase subunit IV family protein [Actinomycetota bacterium]|nr:cytochrome C oxidase subunit IV family protein [Actinomycetota bacterium]
MSTEQHAHPTPAQYWKIAALLGLLTAVEVGMFYVNREYDLGGFNAVILIALAILKFVIVVGWYMHLRFEKSTLTRFFTAGFVLAVGLYLVVLSAMGVVVIRGG